MLCPPAVPEDLLDLRGFVFGIVAVAMDPDIIAGHDPVNAAYHQAVRIPDDVHVPGAGSSVQLNCHSVFSFHLRGPGLPALMRTRIRKR